MAGKITCTTCGKVWQGGDDFLNDTVKCGKENCSQKQTSLPQQQKVEIPRLAFKLVGRKVKTPHHEVETCKIKYNSVDKARAELWYEVPQVIITTMKMK